MNTSAPTGFQRLASFGARALCGALCAALVGAAGAQDREDEADPPGRVGRLSESTGQVWLFSPSSGEWLDAVRNRPITSGDRLATDAGARAEVRVGSTTIRLDSDTELEVHRLDDSRMELELHSGAVAVRLRSREAVDEFELRTGEGRFRAQRTGRYRFDRIDETSHITVTSGSAVYEGPGSALTVYSGQRAEFWLAAGNVAQYTLTEPRRDAFAAWNSARDRSEERSASSRYVSPEMTGAEELDRHGRWEQSDEYGALWIPHRVAYGWAPYSTGHWAWISPWGWTWVDDAPWGFAPFHYGRWVYYRSHWCWAPGQRVHRPVYAPALVAWVGGPRASVSVSIGSGPVVGWFPLAPRETYVPSYRVSPRYVREVNVAHVHPRSIASVTSVAGNVHAEPPRDFSNRKFPHAVTVVPAGVLTQRQPVAPAAAAWRERHDSRELTHEVTRGTPLVAAPVAGPHGPSRMLEPRSITTPGAGRGHEASTGAAPVHTPPGGRVPRPNLTNDGARRGAIGAAAQVQPSAAIAASPAPAPNPPPSSITMRPANPVQAPVIAAPAAPARPAVPAAAQPPAAAATPVVRPIQPAAPAAVPQVAATGRSAEVHALPPRPSGREVPAAGPRPEGPARGMVRAEAPVRQIPERANDAARATAPQPRMRAPEQRTIERGESNRQEPRSARDRAMSN